MGPGGRASRPGSRAVSSREETTGPVRMPDGVWDYLARGTTAAELAEAECAARGGRGRRPRLRSRGRPASPVPATAGTAARRRTESVSYIGQRLVGNDDQAEPQKDPEAGA